MADVEERLSGEEKVRAAGAAEPVSPEPAEPRRICPEWGRGRALVCALSRPSSLSLLRPSACPPVSHPRPRAGAALPGLLAPLLVACVLRK